MFALIVALALLLPACGGRQAETDPLSAVPYEVDPEDIQPAPLSEGWRNGARERDGAPLLPVVGPAVGRERVFIGYGTHLEALRAEDGTLAWRADLVCTTAPVPLHEVVAVPTATAIWWLDAADGVFLGQLQVDSAPVAAAALHQDLLYSDGQAAHRVNPEGPVWSFALPSVTAIATASDAAIAYLSTSTGELVAVEAASGTERWRYSADDGTRLAKAAVAPDRVYVAGTHQWLVALDAQSGKVRWRWPLGVDAVGAPAVVGPVVWVAPLEDTLHGFKTNGTHLFDLELSSRTYVDLVGHGPWVIAGARYGPWVAARAPNRITAGSNPVRAVVARGADLRFSPASGPAGAALVNGDGTVILLRARPQRR